jgi:uncharacterized membrane protein YvlD (DUF360 family)
MWIYSEQINVQIFVPQIFVVAGISLFALVFLRPVLSLCVIPVSFITFYIIGSQDTQLVYGRAAG